MKNIDQLHNTLNDKNIESNFKQRELVAFLKNQTKYPVNGADECKLIAYTIAGLLSTEYAHTLNISDALDQILTLAGELEVEYEEEKWTLLIKMIQLL